jgi:hypothetical protein
MAYVKGSEHSLEGGDESQANDEHFSLRLSHNEDTLR